jgi:hypothetical protein
VIVSMVRPLVERTNGGVNSQRNSMRSAGTGALLSEDAGDTVLFVICCISRSTNYIFTHCTTIAHFTNYPRSTLVPIDSIKLGIAEQERVSLF